MFFGGARFSTQKIFRNLDRATPDYPRARRRHSGDRRFNVLLKRRRLRHRRRPRAESTAIEKVGAAAFAALSLGCFVRAFGGRAHSGPPLLLLPFAGVALIGIWTSGMNSAQKILWSVPAVAITIPFLSVGPFLPLG
jgi:hypothetical protein